MDFKTFNEECRKTILRMGESYIKEKKNNAAEEVFKTLNKMCLDRNNYDVVRTLYALATLLHTKQNTKQNTKEKDYDEAEKMYKEALEICKKILHEKHPSVAHIWHQMAILLHKKKKHIEAEKMYKKALDALKSIYGERHSAVANIFNNLARLLYKEKRDEAEKMYKKALQIHHHCEKQASNSAKRRKIK